MKTITILIVLLAIPVSMSVGQDWFGFDTVNAVVQVYTDTTCDWQGSYYKQKHRTDSLKKELERLTNPFTRPYDRCRDDTIGDFYHWSAWKNKYMELCYNHNELLSKYNALRDSGEQSLDWQGYWRVESTAVAIRRYYDSGWSYKEEMIYETDTTWRPIVPVEADNETQR